MNRQNKDGGCVPQIDHDRNAQEIYNGNLLHHASVFVHQGHERHSKEPDLCLPVFLNLERGLHLPIHNKTDRRSIVFVILMKTNLKTEYKISLKNCNAF